MEQLDRDWIVREDRVGATTTADGEHPAPAGEQEPPEQDKPAPPIERDAGAVGGIAGYHYRSEAVGEPTVETVVRRVPSYNVRAVRIVRYVTITMEIFIAIRFLLELLGASARAPFVAIVYALTELPVAPFQGAFQPRHIGDQVYDPASLVALLIYPLLAWCLAGFIKLYTSRRPPWDAR